MLSYLKSLLSKSITPYLVMAALALVAYIGGLRAALSHERQLNRQVEMEKLNLEAALFETVTLWRDSTQGLLEQNLQLEDLVSTLYRKEGRYAAVISTLQAQLDSVSASAEAPVVVAGDTMSATFRGYEEPVTFVAAVELTPDTGKLDLDMVIDPIDLTIDVGCEETDGRLRRATTVVAGPSWMRLSSETRQRSDVCNPPPAPSSKLVRGLAIGGAVGFLGAVTLLLTVVR